MVNACCGIANNKGCIDEMRFQRLGKICGLGTIFLRGKRTVLLSFSSREAEELKCIVEVKSYPALK